MKKILLLFLISLIITITEAQNCKDLPSNFNSYKEAVSKVENATFQVTDKVTCYNSSWISNANYHSCDGKTGCFILYLRNGRNYIHKDMPLRVWKEFKNSESQGSYYSRNIKEKYRLSL